MDTRLRGMGTRQRDGKEDRRRLEEQMQYHTHNTTQCYKCTVTVLHKVIPSAAHDTVSKG